MDKQKSSTDNSLYDSDELEALDSSDISEFDYYLLLIGYEYDLAQYCNIQRPEFNKVH